MFGTKTDWDELRRIESFTIDYLRVHAILFDFELTRREDCIGYLLVNANIGAKFI